jgi:hypothetical protein
VVLGQIEARYLDPAASDEFGDHGA